MQRRLRLLLAILLLGAAGAVTASGLAMVTKQRTIHSATVRPAADIAALSIEPIQPLPQAGQLDPRKVALGRRLFHEKRFSADDRVACATCHDLRRAGTDGRTVSIGIGGAAGQVNAPTVLNSGFNFRQFWDGRAETLEDQIDGPVQNPAELGSSWPQVIAKLTGDPSYVEQFRSLYPSGIDVGSIKDALATFERSLVTGNSRFDRYLQGEELALTAQERRGYRLFKDSGCSSCHQGILAGGNIFEKFGIVADYFADRGRVTRADFGRFNVTGQESDRFRFKVPSLRNVERTAPYFHDGSAETLDQAVSVMARYQVGRELSSEEIGAIVQFLKTLTGDVD